MKKKLFIFSIIMCMIIISLAGCKKKHNWHEVGAKPVPPVEHFGVQYSKATESNPVYVYIATIYIPTGKNEKGQSTYTTMLYELEELTPDNLFDALIDCGVLTEDSILIDFKTTDSGKKEAVGPGAVGEMKTLKGEVMYVDLDSDLINVDEYTDPKTDEIYEGKKAVGLIDMLDIYDAINNTFIENYQLVDCKCTPGNMEDYDEAH